MLLQPVTQTSDAISRLRRSGIGAIFHQNLLVGEDVRQGSVQHLPFLTDHEKAVYKTAFELDQRWIIELAADRTPEICQSQSLNVFIPGDVDKWDLHMLHYSAWERGVKTTYYLHMKPRHTAEQSTVKVNKSEDINAGGGAPKKGFGFGSGSGSNPEPHAVSAVAEAEPAVAAPARKGFGFGAAGGGN